MGRKAWVHEDPRKQYHGIKRGRIDLVQDEKKQWHDSNGVRYAPFDAAHVPINLLAFVPYCPECLESCFDGFSNWEENEAGEIGLAYRHWWHFWANGSQLWSWPAYRVAAIAPTPFPSTGPISPFHVTTDEDERASFQEGQKAFREGLTRWKNPYDGRKAQGRAWNAGWDLAQQEPATSAS